ncbi:hypothetical protein [Spirosoma sp. KNUC1025]|uniref:hypothetical protein n=1 Tax=Spirosoma sp. KNUC1025 TaxID=2894082 RepID=UPI0038672608|nr:hypothetical protein LN737_19170 [Spirosoma sp. KNUC1025]
MANIIRDQVTTLDIQLYLGNAFTLLISIDEGIILPEVITSTAYSRSGGPLLAEDLQPLVQVTGRALSITYSASSSYPQQGYHEILFDDRKVVAGALLGLRQTVSRAVGQTLTINAYQQAPISLNVATKGAETGQTRFLGEVLEYFDGSVWQPIPTGAIPSANRKVPYTIPFIVGAISNN